jgi:hypothetical protein
MRIACGSIHRLLIPLAAQMPFFNKGVQSVTTVAIFVAPLTNEWQITIVQPTLTLTTPVASSSSEPAENPVVPVMVIPIPLPEDAGPDIRSNIRVFQAGVGPALINHVRSLYGPQTEQCLAIHSLETHAVQLGRNASNVNSMGQVTITCAEEYQSIEIVAHMRESRHAAQCTRLQTLMDTHYPSNAYMFAVVSMRGGCMQPALAISHPMIGQTLYVPCRSDPSGLGQHHRTTDNNQNVRLHPMTGWDGPVYAFGSVSHHLSHYSTQSNIAYDLTADDVAGNQPIDISDIATVIDRHTSSTGHAMIPLVQPKQMRCLGMSSSCVNKDLWLVAYHQLNSVDCTYDAAGGKALMQDWYNCITCGLVGNNGCCTHCRYACHRNHDVMFAGTNYFFCDCGAPASIVSMPIQHVCVARDVRNRSRANNYY